MTRIVAGAARGRRLTVPAGRDTRPTSDRVREALFSSLESQLGAFAGTRVLDLYAGSGALGLEALSRGARQALFVESDPRAVQAIRGNIDALGLRGATVAPGPVERVLSNPPPERYDVVLADPPYRLPGARLTEVLAALVGGWLTPDAVVVVERPARAAPLSWPAGIAGERVRRYGETVLWYGRPAG
ncbi:MAG: 16S rRNA (guanine(966)-N(2))-methyltransferase RsmD [Jiangellaceae bacterium]|nr:16S rRNA (guanine(966)-N(2))-methyltransferase RsmD [Jiangellaceae bacterium]